MRSLALRRCSLGPNRNRLTARRIRALGRTRPRSVARMKPLSLPGSGVEGAGKHLEGRAPVVGCSTLIFLDPRPPRQRASLRRGVHLLTIKEELRMAPPLSACNRALLDA